MPGPFTDLAQMFLQGQQFRANQMKIEGLQADRDFKREQRVQAASKEQLLAPLRSQAFNAKDPEQRKVILGKIASIGGREAAVKLSSELRQVETAQANIDKVKEETELKKVEAVMGKVGAIADAKAKALSRTLSNPESFGAAGQELMFTADSLGVGHLVDKPFWQSAEPPPREALEEFAQEFRDQALTAQDPEFTPMMAQLSAVFGYGTNYNEALKDRQFKQTLGLLMKSKSLAGVIPNPDQSALTTKTTNDLQNQMSVLNKTIDKGGKILEIMDKNPMVQTWIASGASTLGTFIERFGGEGAAPEVLEEYTKTRQNMQTLARSMFISLLTAESGKQVTDEERTFLLKAYGDVENMGPTQLRAALERTMKIAKRGRDIAIQSLRAGGISLREESPTSGGPGPAPRQSGGGPRRVINGTPHTWDSNRQQWVPE